ncbi:hypothetical protein BS47DRAFT_1485282 [Hydnum rufescens UP504]|uniref:Aminoglycoside phosphotransferase domain-containing protein n=1 Tax=Hydnum rufescens UP504 TaxID=1448309 RepID=A0A9P6DX25_9AGAM|nr:hypothetical protein BS47DRAFT_1485282 [Hydnum rufescens UP504]
METTLPDLPFTDYGPAVLGQFHSAVRATPWKYPRTDLQVLRPWTTFPADIHDAIQSAPAFATLSSAAFSIGLPGSLDRVVNRLGVVGDFQTEGSGNTTVIGSPDFSWVMDRDRPHPKLVVEYKPWWIANLENLPAAFENPGASIHSRQSLDALEQVYGYMTFNDNKFGILSNWHHAWFLRRVETSHCKTLEYFHVELGGLNPPVSMLKAWVGLVLLADGDWFYSSPTPMRFPPARYFANNAEGWKDRKKAIRTAGDYHAPLVDGTYECLELDFQLCHFDTSTSRDGPGCVMNVRLPQPNPGGRDLHAVCKIVDVLHDPDAGDLLRDEADAYAALQPLQGSVIPTFYGFYEVWGILRLLALEPVGEAIPEDEEIDETLWNEMRDALQRIHDAGYIHGDIARRNFCRTEEGTVFLVDLERCRLAQDPSEQDDEMDEVDSL